MDKVSIKILENEDADALEVFLSSRMESSMFLMGNMRLAGLSDQGKTYQDIYAAAFKNGDIVSVVAHFLKALSLTNLYSRRTSELQSSQMPHMLWLHVP